MELNKIYNEDCLIGMSAIPDKSVDMILCDLPYGTTACKWDTIIPFEPLWEQYERVIKDNGAIVLTASQPFSSKLVASNFKGFKHEWIWEKERGTGFQVAKYRPMQKHEHILVFTKKGEKVKYYPIKTKLEKPLKSRSAGTESKSNPIGKVKKYEITYTDRHPLSILKFSRDNANRVHPTQKPVALFEYLIKTYTNEGETVLDNCMGSGTTAIACINTKRNYIGFELDEEYYKASIERINNHVKDKQIDLFKILDN